MGDFNRRNFGDRNDGGFKKRGFGGGFGGKRGGFGGGDRRPKEMFPVVCSKCGKDCKVPFRPSGDKPVYCSECFDKQPKNDFKRRDSRNDFTPRNNDNGELKMKMESIEAKLDTILKLLNEVEVVENEVIEEKKAEKKEKKTKKK